MFMSDREINMLQIFKNERIRGKEKKQEINRKINFNSRSRGKLATSISIVVIWVVMCSLVGGRPRF
jgi:hypothetical protein